MFEINLGLSLDLRCIYAILNIAVPAKGNGLDIFTWGSQHRSDAF